MAEENNDTELVSDLTDLQTNCFQPKLSALFEFNYKNIYQQLPQVILMQLLSLIALNLNFIFAI